MGPVVPAEETKRAVFSVLRQEAQTFFQKSTGLGVDQAAGLPFQKIIQRHIVGVLIAVVDAACRYPVTEHLQHVAERHLDAVHRPGLFADPVVRPVFQMVLVASLVMHPGRGVAEITALRIIRTPEPLVVFHARKKLFRRILRQIVGQALPVQTKTEAVVHDEQPVAGDGPEMTEKVLR